MKSVLIKKFNLSNLRPALKHQFLCPTCVQCGHFAVQESLLCKLCEQVFLNNQDHDLIIRSVKDMATEKDVFVYACFYWTDDKQYLNQKLVYMLKQSFSELAWRFYAEQFCKKYFEDQVSKNFRSEEAVFIPVPSTKSKGHHTRYFTHKLSQFLKVRSVDLLIKSEISTEQKRLNLQMRSRIKIKTDPKNISQIGSNTKKIILIDDIITSGSTIQACIEALRHTLGDQIQIEAWCLYDRPKIYEYSSSEACC